MKYDVGMQVTLNDGRNVYIMAVNKKEKKYQVLDMDKENDIFEITDKDVLMRL